MPYTHPKPSEAAPCYGPCCEDAVTHVILLN